MANNMLQSLLFSGGGSGGSSGGDGGVLVVHSENGTLDKTWKELHDAPFAVLRVEESDGFEVVPLTSVTSEDAFYVAFVNSSYESVYETDSENGYPSSEGN